MFLVGSSRTVLQISMNLIICYRVSSTPALTKIAPLVNGTVVSLVMFSSLISSWLTNVVLKNNGSYVNLLVTFGILIILSSLLLKKMHGLAVYQK